MSGRALYPLTMTLAASLAAEFDGRLPLSFSGGAPPGTSRRSWMPGSGPSPLPRTS